MNWWKTKDGRLNVSSIWQEPSQMDDHEKPDYESAMRAALVEIEQYKRLCGSLWQALTFYGDPESYFAISMIADPPCGAFFDDASRIDGVWRPGKLARETIQNARETYGELIITTEEYD